MPRSTLERSNSDATPDSPTGAIPSPREGKVRRESDLVEEANGVKGNAPPVRDTAEVDAHNFAAVLSRPKHANQPAETSQFLASH